MHADMHRPRKRFGQNFLHDRQIISRIVQAIAPGPGQHLVEIGPGRGALTLPLLDAAGSLTAIELDRDLLAPLRAMADGRGELRLIESDALSVDLTALAGTGRIRLVGNLPYNISTPLLFHALEHAAVIEDMHFMLQREVVERMAAPPGGKDYGRLSVMLQWRCQVEALFRVPPGAFFPAPKVESAVVRLLPRPAAALPMVERAKLEAVVRAAFAQRRKTLANSLRGLLPAEAISAAGLDPSQRAETVPVANFVALARLAARGSLSV